MVITLVLISAVFSFFAGIMTVDNRSGKTGFGRRERFVFYIIKEENSMEIAFFDKRYTLYAEPEEK